MQHEMYKRRGVTSSSSKTLSHNNMSVLGFIADTHRKMEEIGVA